MPQVLSGTAGSLDQLAHSRQDRTSSDTAAPMGVGDLRESQGLTPPRLQIAGDTPFHHPIGRGRTQLRNCASHVPCHALSTPGPACHAQPLGSTALCSRHT